MGQGAGRRVGSEGNARTLVTVPRRGRKGAGQRECDQCGEGGLVVEGSGLLFAFPPNVVVPHV